MRATGLVEAVQRDVADLHAIARARLDMHAILVAG